MSIVHVSVAPQRVATAFHKDAYTLAMSAHKAVESHASKLAALLTSRYGDTSPTYAQYREDQATLSQLAKERGLADNQWVRKPFARAVKALYGALPVSTAPEAVLKRQQREEALAKAKAQAGPGAPKGETQERAPSASESIEALITRIGLFKTLEACTRILASDEVTKPQATHLAAVARKAAELSGVKVLKAA